MEVSWSFISQKVREPLDICRVFLPFTFTTPCDSATPVSPGTAVTHMMNAKYMQLQEALSFSSVSFGFDVATL